MKTRIHRKGLGSLSSFSLSTVTDYHRSPLTSFAQTDGMIASLGSVAGTTKVFHNKDQQTTDGRFAHTSGKLQYLKSSNGNQLTEDEQELLAQINPRKFFFSHTPRRNSWPANHK